MLKQVDLQPNTVANVQATKEKNSQNAAQMPSLNEFMDMVQRDDNNVNSTISAYNVYNKYNKTS